MKRVKRRIHLREDHHRDASIESLLQRMNGVVATAEDSIVGGKIQRRSLVAFCLLLQYWQAPFFYLEVSRSKTTSTCPWIRSTAKVFASGDHRYSTKSSSLPSVSG